MLLLLLRSERREMGDDDLSGRRRRRELLESRRRGFAEGGRGAIGHHMLQLQHGADITKPEAICTLLPTLNKPRTSWNRKLELEGPPKARERHPRPAGALINSSLLMFAISSNAGQPVGRSHTDSQSVAASGRAIVSRSEL